MPNIYFFVLHNVDDKALYYWLMTLDSVKPQNISNVPSHRNVFITSRFKLISTFFFKWSSYIIYLNLNKYVKPQKWPLCIKPQRWPLCIIPQWWPLCTKPQQWPLRTKPQQWRLCTKPQQWGLCTKPQLWPLCTKHRHWV